MKKAYFLIALMIFGIGLSFGQTPPSIDSVWFWEETDCNDSNIVHICYILSDPEGDPATISVQMSADSGATWTVPLTTLLNDANDLGDSIMPGTHCFDWIMSEDMPDSEGYDWMVEVGEVSFLDTFEVVDSTSYLGSDAYYGHGLGYGDGYFWIYHSGRDWVYKTECVAPLIGDTLGETLCPKLDSLYLGADGAGAWWNCDIDYDSGYVYYARTNDAGDLAPDTIFRIDVDTEVKEVVYVPELDHSIQGLDKQGHYLYYRGTEDLDIARIDLTTLPAISCDTFLSLTPPCDIIEGMAYGYGFLWGSNNNGRIIQIDLDISDVVGCYPVPNVEDGAEGLCFDGEYLWYHNYHAGHGTRRIYKIRLRDETASSFIFHAPLDSDPPTVAISCPTSSVIAGDSHAFDWIVDDLFLDDDPCSLHFFSGPCGIDERYTATGGSYDWSVPMVDCSACTLVIAARDSFCNWGYDTCVFEIQIANLPPSIDSVWFWEETDCNDSNIVHICYILSDAEGDPATISVQMSADSGATWTVPLVTLIGAEDAIGDSIYPGTHCFQWIMSEDMPDSEGYDWMVEVGILSLFDTFLVIDSIDISSRITFGSGLAYGDGYYWIYENDFGWIYKTSSMFAPADDSIFIGLGHNCDIDYSEGYLYYAKSGMYPTNIYRKNVITEVEELIASLPTSYMCIQGLQVVGNKLIVGYYASSSMQILSYDLTSPLPIHSYTTLISESHSDCHSIEGLAYAFGFLWGCNNSGRIAQIDLTIPDYIGCYPVTMIGTGAEGLCWDGEFLWYHNGSAENIYKILIADTLTSYKVSLSPLDSDPPSVAISCPTSTVIAGDSHAFDWIVDDLFFDDDPCSLHFFSGPCGIDERYTATGGSYDWSVPMVDCSACTLVIAARDSFCNWDYDTCVFEIEIANLPPSIDSVWFWEETDCNDSNIVHICYILSDAEGDPATISAQMSADSGATWTVPLVTLIGAEDAIGDSIYPGTHCFQWIMSEDIPDSEGYDWMVEVGVPTFLDTFAIIDSIRITSSYGWGLAYGDAHYFVYNQSTGYVYKKRHIHPDSSSVAQIHIGSSYNMDIDYHDGYIYYCTNRDGYTSDDSLKRMDFSTGSVEQLFFSSTIPNIQGVQVMGSDLLATDNTPSSYGVGMWTLYRFNLEGIIPSSAIDTVITELKDSTNNLEGMAYAAGYLWGSNNFGRITQIDPNTYEKINSYPVPNIGNGAEGLCWDGRYMWYQNNATRKIYQIMILDSTASYMRAYAPLDSDPPLVAISCPTDTIFGGDTVHFHWTIDDLFWANDECTLFVGYCEAVDTILLSDTLYSWIAPGVMCDSAWVKVAVRDSFCNWGYDSCSFTIFGDTEPVIVVSGFPWDNAYSACDTLNIWWLLFDLSGIDTLSAVVSINGDTLTYPHPLLSWNGDTLFYELVTEMFPDTITACLLECEDIWGNPLESPPYCMVFYNDLGAPVVLGYGPDMTGDLSPIIWACVVDSGSGVDSMNLTFRIDGTTYGIGDGGFSWSSDSFYFDCALAGLSFAVGETIDVCITASDMPDLCNANMADTCWSLVFADTIPPEVTLISPPESSISACEDQAVIWLFSDIGMGIDTASIVVTIDGDTADIGLLWSGDTLTFVPDTNWAEGTHFACVIAGADLWGLELVDDSSCVEFEIDLSPPEISILSPACGSTIGDTLAEIVFLVSDAPAGVLWQSVFIAIESDTFWFDSLYHSGDSVVFRPTEFGLVWADSSTINFCIGAADSADFCTGDNFADTCCAFTIDASGTWATIISPPEGVVSSCDDQGVRWRLFGDPLDWTIRVDVNGTIYYITDSELARNLDTLIFTPAIPWTSGDIVSACLVEMADTFGNPLAATVCVNFTIDLEPPVFSNLIPAHGAIIDNPSPIISVDVEDLIAGLDVSSLSLFINGVPIAHDFDGLSISFDCAGVYTFSGGETVEICVHAEDLAELCGANSGDTCWSFSIATGGPVITPIFPAPMAISACDDQGAIFIYDDPQGIDETTIWATIDGDTIDLWTFSNDTLYIEPPSGYFSNGDTVTVCAGGSDILGNPPDSISCITYVIDLSPPVYSNFSPSCADTVQNTMPTISVEIEDIIAGIDISSVWMTIEGDLATATFDGTTFSWSPDSNLIPNQWIEICVGASDSPDLCDPNESDTCCSFYVLGDPDLWPDNLAFEPASPVEEGVEFTFLGWIFNDNIQDVGEFTVCVLQDGINIGSITIPQLMMGESDSIGWPLSLPAGDYQLCFFADCDSSIVESDNTNNIACLNLVVLGAECDVHPNPFTPNADGSNDEAIFEYPGQGSGNPVVKIYDLQNRLIKEIPDDIRVWDGTDTGGNKMPRGVYLYLVLRDSEVVCKGTVYLGR